MSFMRYYNNIKKKLIKADEVEDFNDRKESDNSNDLVNALIKRNAILEKQNDEFLQRINKLEDELSVVKNMLQYEKV